jgi:hypothetical protein
LESFYFCDLGAHAKFWNPTTTASGTKVTAGEERKSRKKNNSGLPKLIRWSHTLGSDKNNKKVAYLVAPLVACNALGTIVANLSLLFYLYNYGIKAGIK